MSDLFTLKGKCALVTGAGRGLGKAIAIGLANEGAEVVLISRSEQELEKTVDEILRNSGSARYLLCDITKRDEVEKLFVFLDSNSIHCDILVNNAGTNIRKRAFASSYEDWQHVINTNLSSAYSLSVLAAQRMARKGNGGRIVNIGSIAGEISCDTGAAYAASKAGMSGMTRTLAVEWAEHKITVNCIAPWYFRTPLTEPVLSNREKLERILSRTPLRRVGEPKDISSLAVFLSSDASSFITGQTIPLDGGMSIFGFTPH